MSEVDYYSVQALSQSGMKDLAVSPYRFWHCHLNPNRPKEEPTLEMQVGSALHCAILEPNEFDKRYACEVNGADYPDLLVTMEDLRGFVRDKGQTPKGTRKAEVIAQVQLLQPDAPILDVIVERHAAQHAGKTIFNLEDWYRIGGMAQALRDEPMVQQLLATGRPEVEIFMEDPDTGVPLKGKLDWMADTFTLDLKTFSQKRSKSIDQSIADAIFYESYYRQAYFYALLRGWPRRFCGDCIIPFVESEEPHEVRIRRLMPKIGGAYNLYWNRAMLEVREFIRTYKECMDHFGPDRPWKYAQDITALSDEEMKGLAFN